MAVVQPGNEVLELNFADVIDGFAAAVIVFAIVGTPPETFQISIVTSADG
jgi:hypothetical protein